MPSFNGWFWWWWRYGFVPGSARWQVFRTVGKWYSSWVSLGTKPREKCPDEAAKRGQWWRSLLAVCRLRWWWRCWSNQVGPMDGSPSASLWAWWFVTCIAMSPWFFVQRSQSQSIQQEWPTGATWPSPESGFGICCRWPSQADCAS